MKDPRKFLKLLVILLIVFAIPACTIREANKKEAREEVTDRTDSDLDGLYDSEEKQRGTDPDKKDTDGDGLTDYEEAKTWVTDPNKADTDGDGVKDGEEVETGYDPRSLTGQLDSDSDGLGNADEKKLGTDPDKADTDGDGISDKQEKEAGGDPL